MYFTTIRLVFFMNGMRESVDIIKPDTLMFINMSFVFDMFLSLHTGYYESGLIILDRKKIAIRYIKEILIYDMLAYIPLLLALFITKQSSDELIMVGFSLEMLIFSKSISLSKIFQRLERVVTENEKVADWWPLIRLVVNVAVLGHVVGLLYYAQALLQEEILDEQETWIDEQGLHDQGWFTKYLNCIYWSISTMVSNIVFQPKTKYELMFSILMIMMMTFIFGYVLNTIGMILSEIEKKTSQFKLDRQMLNRYMKKKQLPENLREKLSLYLDYIQSLQKERNHEEEEKVFKLMSEPLKIEILQQINRNNIKKFSVIERNFSHDTLQETLLIIEEVDFNQDGIIYKTDTHNQHNENMNINNNLGFNDQNPSLNKEAEEQAIFFLKKGKLEVYHENQESKKIFIAGEIAEGQIFGDFEFFTGLPRAFNIRAKEASSILKISRSKFLDIISRSEDDTQLFQMIADGLRQMPSSIESTGRQFWIEEGNESIFNIYKKCMICQENGHFSSTCYKVHYIVNCKKLIYEYNNYQIQIKRLPKERSNDSRRYNSLGDMDEIIQEHNEFLTHLVENPDMLFSSGFRQHNDIEQSSSYAKIEADTSDNKLTQINEDENESNNSPNSKDIQNMGQSRGNRKNKRQSLDKIVEQTNQQQNYNGQNSQSPKAKTRRASIQQQQQLHQNQMQFVQPSQQPNLQQPRIKNISAQENYLSSFQQNGDQNNNNKKMHDSSFKSQMSQKEFSVELPEQYLQHQQQQQRSNFFNNNLSNFINNGTFQQQQQEPEDQQKQQQQSQQQNEFITLNNNNSQKKIQKQGQFTRRKTKQDSLCNTINNNDLNKMIPQQRISFFSNSNINMETSNINGNNNNMLTNGNNGIQNNLMVNNNMMNNQISQSRSNRNFTEHQLNYQPLAQQLQQQQNGNGFQMVNSGNKKQTYVQNQNQIMNNSNSVQRRAAEMNMHNYHISNNLQQQIQQQYGNGHLKNQFHNNNNYVQKTGFNSVDHYNLINEEVDIDNIFDKMRFWNVYYPQFNFKTLKYKNKDIGKFFKNTQNTECSNSDSDSDYNNPMMMNNNMNGTIKNKTLKSKKNLQSKKSAKGSVFGSEKNLGSTKRLSKWNNKEQSNESPSKKKRIKFLEKKKIEEQFNNINNSNISMENIKGNKQESKTSLSSTVQKRNSDKQSSILSFYKQKMK